MSIRSPLLTVGARNAQAALRQRAIAARREAAEIFDLLEYIEEIEMENRSLNQRMQIVREARGEA